MNPNEIKKEPSENGIVENPEIDLNVDDEQKKFQQPKWLRIRTGLVCGDNSDDGGGIPVIDD